MTSLSTKKAWAIDPNSTEGYGFLGIYAFDSFTKTEPWQDGLRTALFRTRDEAQAALRKMKSEHSGYFPKSTVRRVLVTIEALREGTVTD